MVLNEDGGSDDGQVQFRDLVSQGILQDIPAWSTAPAAAARIASTGIDDGSDDVGSEDSDSGSTDDDDDSTSASSDGSDSAAGSSSDTSSDPSSDSSDSDPDPSSSADTGDDGDTGTYDNAQTTLNTLSFAGHQISNVYTALKGFEREWDACSSTPYLRSAAARQVVTYDDPQSLEMKAVFVRYAGLLGVNMFDIHGDTDSWDLTDALRRGLGL